MTIKYSTIRRVRVTAPMSERQKVLDWLWENDYRVTRSGPKALGPGRADVTKLLIVAEKRIK